MLSSNSDADGLRFIVDAVVELQLRAREGDDAAKEAIEQVRQTGNPSRLISLLSQDATASSSKGVNALHALAVSVPRSAGAGIGRSNYASIQDFADAVTVKYQQFYDDAYANAYRMVDLKLLKNERLAIGSKIDRDARFQLRDWLLNSEGIQEGAGQIIAVNRRLYDPLGSGLYRQPDVYIPGARLILDGSLEMKAATAPQILGFRAYSGGANVTIIKPTAEPGSFSFLFR